MNIHGGIWGWLVAILAGAAGIGAVWLSGRKSGAAEVEAETAEATVETQQRMQRAEESGPRTGSEAVDTLRRGGL